MSAYYNEHDPFAAAWLRELMADGQIAPGDVDERDIRDIRPDELAGYTQCHFFAGIGVWSHALRSAGWPDDEPVWTGSCPCQPFSAAGKRGGFADERHLWPAFFHLIRESRPGVVFGEQVASKDGLEWIDLVHSDLEGEGYAVAAVDLCAAGLGAPHIRQRLYWVADAGGVGLRGRRRSIASDKPGEVQRSGGLRDARLVGNADDAGPQGQPEQPGAGRGECAAGAAGAAGGVGDAARVGWGKGRPESSREQGRPDVAEPSPPGGMERTEGLGWSGRQDDYDGGRRECSPGPAGANGATRGFWADALWIPCRDGKMRPAQPGIFPLASGTPNRVGTLRGAGNALTAPVAQTFIESWIDEVTV